MRFLLFKNARELWTRPNADGSVSPWFDKSCGERLECLDGESAVFLAQECSLQNATLKSLRDLFFNSACGDYSVLSRASELVTWRLSHRFCSACGSALVRDKVESAMSCKNCGAMYWPRINPASIVLVHRGDEILLTRKSDPAVKFWSLVAGFVESGETMEEAAVREVLEETGVEIGFPQYRMSQAWPFPNSLMVGFVAQWKSGEPVPDGKELLEAKWFKRGNLPKELPLPTSIADRLIKQWLAE